MPASPPGGGARTPLTVYQLFRYMDQRDPKDTWDIRKPETALINIDDVRLA